MFWFQTVLVLCLLGVLLPKVVVEAQEKSIEVIRPIDKVPLNSRQQRQVYGRVVSLVGNALESLAMKKGRLLKKHYIPGTYPFDKSRLKIASYSQLGVAKINYYGEGVICSGVHFKPWIILTTADCLNGREVGRLYATVTWRDTGKGTLHTAPVETQSVEIHPEYSFGRNDFNFALMKIYARFDWDVEEFIPPRTYFSSEALISRNTMTFAKEWDEPLTEDSTMSNINKPVTTDFSFCGEPGGNVYWYCAVTGNGLGRRILKPMDVGSPLYFRVGNMRRCLGIYSGRFVNQPMTGHLYHSFYPCIDWIDQFIHENQVPPMPM